MPLLAETEWELDYRFIFDKENDIWWFSSFHYVPKNFPFFILPQLKCIVYSSTVNSEHLYLAWWCSYNVADSHAKRYSLLWNIVSLLLPRLHKSRVQMFSEVSLTLKHLRSTASLNHTSRVTAWKIITVGPVASGIILNEQMLPDLYLCCQWMAEYLSAWLTSLLTIYFLLIRVKVKVSAAFSSYYLAVFISCMFHIAVASIAFGIGRDGEWLSERATKIKRTLSFHWLHMRV